jgi:hypothetical protein
MINHSVIRSWHIVLVVDTVTKLWAGRTRNRGSIYHRCQIFISCPKRPDPVVDLPHPPGTGGFFLAIKWPGSESDHSPHLVMSLRMSRGVPPVSYLSSCRAWEYLDLYFTFPLSLMSTSTAVLAMAAQKCVRLLYRLWLGILGVLFIEKKHFPSNFQALVRNLFRLFRDFYFLRVGRSDGRMHVGPDFPHPSRTALGPPWVQLLLLQGKVAGGGFDHPPPLEPRLKVV